MEGGGDPGQDAAGVQQGHGGRQAGSGWLQDGAEGQRAQRRRRGLLPKVRTATSPGAARAARPEPRHSGPWRPERGSRPELSRRSARPASLRSRGHVVPGNGDDTAFRALWRLTRFIHLITKGRTEEVLAAITPF